MSTKTNQTDQPTETEHAKDHYDALCASVHLFRSSRAPKSRCIAGELYAIRDTLLDETRKGTK